MGYNGLLFGAVTGSGVRQQASPEWMSTNMHNAIWHYQTTVKDWIHASVTQGDVLVVDIVQCRPWLHIIASVEYTFSQIYKYTILIKYKYKFKVFKVLSEVETMEMLINPR